MSEYCTAYANAICQISQTCAFEASTCESFQTAQCQSQATAATASGTRVYTPNNVGPCIAALNAAYNNNGAPISASALSNIQTVCAQVFVGSAGEGAACTSDFDCTVSGDICATAPGISGATCAAPTPKQLNDVCADPGDQCPTDAYCGASGGTSKCLPAQADGASCSATLPCVTTDYCNNGTCTALGQLSEPCSSTADCSSGLFCDLYTDTEAPTPVCVTQLTFARGSVDCLGVEGDSTNGMVGSSSGGGDAGGGSSGGGDSGTAGDAATGG